MAIYRGEELLANVSSSGVSTEELISDDYDNAIELGSDDKLFTRNVDLTSKATLSTNNTFSGHNTFTGEIYANGAASLAVRQARNISAGTGNPPSSMPVGSIYLQYE